MVPLLQMAMEEEPEAGMWQLHQVVSKKEIITLPQVLGEPKELLPLCSQMLVICAMRPRGPFVAC